MIASKTIAVEVAPGLRVRVVGGCEVPGHLQAAYRAAMGEAPIVDTPGPVPEKAPDTMLGPVVVGALEGLSRQDLMKRAVAAGVPAKGASADLIEAIRAAEAGQV